MIASNQRQFLKLTQGDDVARTYSSWTEMRRRVRHASPDRKSKCYENVLIDPSWKDFETFLSDMGVRPNGTTIDRIDPSGNYTKDNCRWANATVQSRNRLYCVMNAEKAMQARAMYASGLSQQLIAQRFKCSQKQISNIVRNLAWT